MLADLADLVGSVAYTVLDIASAGGFSRDTGVKVLETLTTVSLIAVMLFFAMALSSWIIAGTAITLPWIMRARLRHAWQLHSGIDASYERQQRHFYTAMIIAFGAALLLELSVAMAVPASAAAMSPTVLAHIPSLAITHLAVAAAFPAALWAFWHTKNRTQAAGGGLLAAGLIGQAFEQVARGGTIAWPPAWPFTVDLMILGASVLALGTILAPTPIISDRISRRDLRGR